MFWLFGCAPFLPNPFMKVHVSFTKVRRQKKNGGKNREYVMLIWVHDMWHHCAPYTYPYQLHDDAHVLKFLFLFLRSFFCNFIAKTFSSLVVIIGSRFWTIKLAQIKEKKKRKEKRALPTFSLQIASILIIWILSKPHSRRFEECSCTFDQS